MCQEARITNVERFHILLGQLLERLGTCMGDRDMKFGVLIAMSKDGGTGFSYIPCATAKVHLGLKGASSLAR